MIITKNTVEYIAELSKLKLSEEEAESLSGSLGEIIEYAEMLGELDTSNNEGLSDVLSVTNVMRGDIVGVTSEREALLKNAPRHTDSTVTVPKTVE